MKRSLIAFVFIVFAFASCKKEVESPYNSNVYADMTVEFDNIVGGANLQLNTGVYTNAAGEQFTIDKLKYYVSNFVLTSATGATFTVPQDSCYFLIDEEVAASLIARFKVPEGEYKTLSFVLGVDSLRSTADISRRTGVLDPTATGGEMYWSWNSGYIFFKMEGTSPASPMGYMYHIGGFGGYSSPTINNIKTITLDLSARGTPKVKNGKEANVHLMADVMKALNGSTNVSIAANPMVMFSPASAAIATNYTSMFTHDHTEN